MQTTLAIILVLGLLIFFHELGHFLVARMLRIGVRTFSLGFGPKLLALTRGRTTYKLSAFPLGGYVQLVGERREDDLPEGWSESESFIARPAWHRMLVVVAGPVFNFVLAWIIFTGIFAVSGMDLPVIEDVYANSPAQAVGLEPGDTVVSINGDQVVDWRELQYAVLLSDGDPLNIGVERGSQVLNFTVTPNSASFLSLFSMSCTDLPVVHEVYADSPALTAGMAEGDTVLSINGNRVTSCGELQYIINSSHSEPMDFVVQRDGQELDLTVLPAPASPEDMEFYLIGVALESTTVDVPLLQAAGAGVTRFWHEVKNIGIGFGKLISGDIPVKKALGGPILIGQMVSHGAQQGLGQLLFLTAFISINLGILNLLPIPVLDGGHLLFYSLETVFRRPVNQRVQEITTQVGLVLLISLMVFATYNDIDRNWQSITSWVSNLF